MLLFSHPTAPFFCIEIKTSPQLHYVCSHNPFQLLLYSVLTCLGKRWTICVRLNEAQTLYHFLASPSSRVGRGGKFISSPLKPVPHMCTKLQTDRLETCKSSKDCTCKTTLARSDPC